MSASETTSHQNIQILYREEEVEPTNEAGAPTTSSIASKPANLKYGSAVQTVAEFG